MLSIRRRRWNNIFKSLSIIIVFLSVFGIIWLRTGVVSLEYRISILEKKKKELARDVKMASVEKANLLSVEKVETAASDEFVFPDRTKVVFVKRANDNYIHNASLSASNKRHLEGYKMP